MSLTCSEDPETNRTVSFDEKSWEDLMDLLNCSAAMAEYGIIADQLKLNIGKYSYYTTAERWYKLYKPVLDNLGVTLAEVRK